MQFLQGKRYRNQHLENLERTQQLDMTADSVYPMKYMHIAHVLLCFALAHLTHVLQGYFTGTGAII